MMTKDAASADPDTPVSDYSESSFWEKLKQYAKQAGREVIEKALWLHYAAQRPETPMWAKTVIYGALVYFISPLDAVPDVTPVVGYVDDLGAIGAAIATVGVHVNQPVKELAAAKLRDWFD